ARPRCAGACLCLPWASAKRKHRRPAPAMQLKKHHFVYTGVAALAVVCAFILYLGYISWSPINREAVARIRPRMTEGEVEAILGGPYSHSQNLPVHLAKQQVFRPAALKTWSDRQASCTVLFDGDDRVIGASFHEGPTLLDRIFAALGIPR